MGDKMKRNICVSSDLDVDTLDWEFLSIIGLWQLFSFITNYHQPLSHQPVQLIPVVRTEWTEWSDLILFLGKNCHNILSPEPATILPPVPQPEQAEAGGWLVRGWAASDWLRGRGRGWQGESRAWYWRIRPASLTLLPGRPRLALLGRLWAASLAELEAEGSELRAESWSHPQHSWGQSWERSRPSGGPSWDWERRTR